MPTHLLTDISGAPHPELLRNLSLSRLQFSPEGGSGMVRIAVRTYPSFYATPQRVITEIEPVVRSLKIRSPHRFRLVERVKTRHNPAVCHQDTVSRIQPRGYVRNLGRKSARSVIVPHDRAPLLRSREIVLPEVILIEPIVPDCKIHNSPARHRVRSLPVPHPIISKFVRALRVGGAEVRVFRLI